jgi:hypothetical protein
MTLLPDYSTKFMLICDSFTKEMGPEEFIEFVQTKRHMIKASRFVPPVIGSRGLGKFIVEIQDGNSHLAYRKIGQRR